MRKNLFKLISCLMCFTFIFSSSFVFADEILQDETKIIDVSNYILNVFSWFAYIIALGVLLFIGIKYVVSTANERANLKGLFIKYIIGIAAIVLCATIAKTVAGIAGNDTAEEVIDKSGLNFQDTSGKTSN